jgi:hypothetical protein
MLPFQSTGTNKRVILGSVAIVVVVDELEVVEVDTIVVVVVDEEVVDVT